MNRSPVALLIMVLPLILLTLVGWVILQNAMVPLPLFKFAGGVYKDVPMWEILGGIFLATLGSAFCVLWGARTELKAEAKHTELRREKAEVKAEATGDKVRTLEAKIETLEKALDQALAAPKPKAK